LEFFGFLFRVIDKLFNITSHLLIPLAVSVMIAMVISHKVWPSRFLRRHVSDKINQVVFVTNIALLSSASFVATQIFFIGLYSPDLSKVVSHTLLALVFMSYVSAITYCFNLYYYTPKGHQV
jgi:hypothetical protein